MTKPLLLILVMVSEARRAALGELFELLYAPDPPRRAEAIAQHGSRVRAVLTNGTTGLRPDEIDAMPQLTLACALGAGYEGMAVEHARARGIVLANGAGTNDACVADHAFALLLATVRAIPALDRACRAGVWREALPMQPMLAGKRLGVLGLGTIGRRIAQRAIGFDMAVGYHNRKPVPDVVHAWFDSAEALAAWCDVLVIATPGGSATRHLVNATVLRALGSGGYVVNVARGSVVDTDALAQALRDGVIAGAGLDVYESEPAPPAPLLDLPNVVLTPHVAGWSPESVQASVDLFIENARRHLAGESVLTPI